MSAISCTLKTIARNFWGKAWCYHISLYQDYASRLPRARTYLREGRVLDLDLTPSRLEARVRGKEEYHVQINIAPLPPERWEALKQRCAGEIDSLTGLLRGDLPEKTLRELCDPETGLFPKPAEIQCICNCLDWADLCKHSAAVLYGFGVRLDEDPRLLFTLRNIDPKELFRESGSRFAENIQTELDLSDLSAAFDLDLE